MSSVDDRILIAGPAWVGDMVMAQSLFKVLRAQSPQAKIDVVAPPWSEPLLARMPERGESIRQLAYHLYTLCERKGWAEDARAYNELITAWHAIVTSSHDVGHVGEQAELYL